MPVYADAPVEILQVGKRDVYVFLTELDDGGWAVDYEAHPAVIRPAIMTPPPPRRRCLVAPSKEEALRKARDRFRLMYGTFKLRSVDPERLVYH